MNLCVGGNTECCKNSIKSGYWFWRTWSWVLRSYMTYCILHDLGARVDCTLLCSLWLRIGHFRVLLLCQVMPPGGIQQTDFLPDHTQDRSGHLMMFHWQECQWWTPDMTHFHHFSCHRSFGCYSYKGGMHRCFPQVGWKKHLFSMLHWKACIHHIF